MYCKYCGNNLSDDAKFCPNCGNNVSEIQDDFVQEAPIEVGAPAEDEQKNSLSNKILSSAIVSLALCILAAISISTIPFVLAATKDLVSITAGSLVALVINIVALCIKGSAKRKVRQFSALYGDLTAKARVGKILCIPSTILNIVLLAYDVIFFLAGLAANQ